MSYIMRVSRTQSWWRVCLLGAINGVLFGAIIELLREWYFAYEWRLMVKEFEQFGDDPPLTGDPLHWWAIPVLSTVAFAISSFLIHKFGANYLKFPLLLWQVIGVMAVTALNTFFRAVIWLDGLPSDQKAISNDIKSLMSGMSFSEIITSRSIFRDFFVCLAIVTVMNLIYGTVIQLSVMLYERDNIS